LGTNGAYEEIGSTSAANFTDSDVFYTNQYFYKVNAENLFGQSGYSQEASPPVVSVALLSTNQYILVGSSNLLAVQALDADYSINQSEILRNLNTNLVLCTSSFTPFTNAWTPTLQDTYSFVATAVDTAGNSWFSPPLTITVYLSSNTNQIPNDILVQQGNNPLNPWIPPTGDTNSSPPTINLVVPANAALVP
jgi:hypothetical protein